MSTGASREDPPTSLINAGDVIDGKYLVGECIAWGGMGIVTDAMHLHLQKPVALKCIRSEFLDNDEMVTRFLNEARIAANLRNEHVARVLDFGKTEAGIPYLVMERLEGMSLSASVQEQGPLPEAEPISIRQYTSCKNWTRAVDSRGDQSMVALLSKPGRTERL